MMISPISWFKLLFLKMLLLVNVNGAAAPGIEDDRFIGYNQSLPSMFLAALIFTATGVKLVFMSLGSMTTLFIIFIYFFCRKQARIIHKRRNFNNHGGRYLERVRSSHAAHKEFQLYTPDEIELATSNFDPRRLIDTSGGKARSMYRAMLADGSKVAVKGARDVSKKLREMFIEEAAVLTQIEHPNIVPLLGFSLETDHTFLVYPLIEGENLLSIIENARHATSRAWTETKGFVRNIADSLFYLHSTQEGRIRGICHRDIRLENVLVDGISCTAYLTNFGLARIQETEGSQVLDNPAGLSAYTDPEIWDRRTYTTASDVYSMGVCMAQILTGVSLKMDPLIVTLFIKHVMDKSKAYALDQRFDVVGQEGGDEELWCFALVACACLRQQGFRRPKMDEVANILWGRIPLPRDYQVVKEHVPHRI